MLMVTGDTWSTVNPAALRRATALLIIASSDAKAGHHVLGDRL